MVDDAKWKQNLDYIKRCRDLWRMAIAGKDGLPCSALTAAERYKDALFDDADDLIEAVEQRDALQSRLDFAESFCIKAGRAGGQHEFICAEAVEMRGRLAEVTRERDEAIEGDELRRNRFMSIAKEADFDLDRYRKIVLALIDPSLPWAEIKDGDTVLVGGHIPAPGALASALAQVQALERAAVLAVMPLEAMNMAGLSGYPPDVAAAIREGIIAVRNVLATQPLARSNGDDLNEDGA